MVSRDFRVHLSAVVVAAVVLVAIGVLSSVLGLAVPALVVQSIWFWLLLGGAHLYLALRGDGETVPVAARWRYVGLLAVGFLVWLAARTVDTDQFVAGLHVRTAILLVAALAATCYWLLEARAGYRSVRS